MPRHEKVKMNKWFIIICKYYSNFTQKNIQDFSFYVCQCLLKILNQTRTIISIVKITITIIFFYLTDVSSDILTYGQIHNSIIFMNIWPLTYVIRRFIVWKLCITYFQPHDVHIMACKHIFFIDHSFIFTII